MLNSVKRNDMTLSGSPSVLVPHERDACPPVGRAGELHITIVLNIFSDIPDCRNNSPSHQFSSSLPILWGYRFGSEDLGRALLVHYPCSSFFSKKAYFSLESEEYNKE